MRGATSKRVKAPIMTASGTVSDAIDELLRLADVAAASTLADAPATAASYLSSPAVTTASAIVPTALPTVSTPESTASPTAADRVGNLNWSVLGAAQVLF